MHDYFFLYVYAAVRSILESGGVGNKETIEKTNELRR